MVVEKPRFKLRLDGTFEHLSGTLPMSVDDLEVAAFSGQYAQDPWQNSLFDGGKFDGGFGPTQIHEVDYWTLRARSAQLFNENLYAKGIIDRLVSNEINTGLTPEACPDEDIIGVPEDSLQDWTESVENRFNIYAKSPNICDWKKENTFGALQRYVRSESLIEGDVLIVLRQSPITKLPMVQVVGGSKVRTPLGNSFKLRKGHKIRHGVEFDSAGRIAAHWIDQEEGGSKRIPAYGDKTGRRLSWLVYGTSKRMDSVRGMPLLSVVMQSLKEIDRYRDSAQRKAVVNSILAMFIKKEEDKPGSLPFTGGATQRGSTVSGSEASSSACSNVGQVPGVVLENLQQGETPVGFHSQGTDVSFGVFEEAIISAVAWTLGIPPEILTLSFSSNYSASQAAINEFKIAINQTWGNFGDVFCSRVYNEWLINQALMQKISAPGLLDSWRDPAKHDIFGAWVAVDWYGSIKPSTDSFKQARGSELMLKLGLTTYARESRVNTGTKFSKNMKRQKREQELIVDAARPMAEFKREFGEDLATEAVEEATSSADIEAMIDEYLEENASDND